VLLFATLLPVGGCSGRVATYPVSGTVMFADGHPVASGVIEFRSPDTGVTARAKLVADGTFELGTFDDADGAPAGKYQVVIVQFFTTPPRGHVHGHANHDHDEAEHDHSHHHDARIAAKYSKYSTTPLRAEVRSNGENKFDFVVNHPK
jgi:hypothetical protein